MRRLLRRFWRWFTHADENEAWALQWLRDFQKQFPGQCGVCAWHRWGREMRFLPVSLKVEPHPCPEGNKHPPLQEAP